MNENKVTKNKGFTLVELIIVIAILAVIAAIAAPNLIGNIKDSRIRTDISNAKVIGEAAVVLVAKEEKYEAAALIPDTGRVAVASIKSPSTDADNFINALVAYLQTVPTPKAVTASNPNFLISVEKGVVKVYSDSKLIYPTVDTTYGN